MSSDHFIIHLIDDKFINEYGIDVIQQGLKEIKLHYSNTVILGLYY